MNMHLSMPSILKLFDLADYRLRKRKRRSPMMKRNIGGSTIIVVQSIKSIHHPVKKRKEGTVVIRRAQTMKSIQIQKTNHIENQVEVRRMGIAARSTRSSHLLANQIQKPEKTIEIVSRETMTGQRRKTIRQKIDVNHSIGDAMLHLNFRKKSELLGCVRCKWMLNCMKSKDGNG